MCPIKSTQQLKDFYAWFVQRQSKVATGALTISRSWSHITLLGYFHGYISASEWQQGEHIPSDAKHGITFRKNTSRLAKANAKEVAQTAEDGYEASNRKYLEDAELEQMSARLWDSNSAEDCMLYNCFTSIGSQTLIRATELLHLLRMRTFLSESAQYQTSLGRFKMLEVVSKGEQKSNKTNFMYSWMIRRRQIDNTCPFFWTAARLFHDYQRMQPGRPGSAYGSMVDVMTSRTRGDAFGYCFTQGCV